MLNQFIGLVYSLLCWHWLSDSFSLCKFPLLSFVQYRPAASRQASGPGDHWPVPSHRHGVRRPPWLGESSETLWRHHPIIILQGSSWPADADWAEVHVSMTQRAREWGKHRSTQVMHDWHGFLPPADWCALHIYEAFTQPLGEREFKTEEYRERGEKER